MAGTIEQTHFLSGEAFSEIASLAVKIEARTNLLFSFEKMAFRDAVRSASGAETFASSLYDFLYGRGKPPSAGMVVDHASTAATTKEP